MAKNIPFFRSEIAKKKIIKVDIGVCGLRSIKMTKENTNYDS